MKEQEEIKKPLSLIMEEAENEMIKTVNDLKLPFYLLEKIIDKIHFELLRQIDLEKEAYKESEKKEEIANGEN